MPQVAKQIGYNFRALAELMVKEQDLHDGHWGIFVRFALSASNVGNNADEMYPAAIVPVTEIGIQRFDEANALTVDASVVNPSK